jgi:ABC-type branched-subunit amino acid transport system substrate-binding protein
MLLSEGREMRFKGRLWRLLALFFAFTLVAAACGDDSGDDEASDDTTDDTTDTTEPAGGSADGVLAFGGLLPQTGDLAFLGPPEEAGVQLAVEDINAAGGVLGADVTFDPGDSGDTNTDIANQTTDRHLANGVDAIIGAASSGVSFTVIDKITGANVIQFSGANTSPDFTTYDDNGLYFRTAPSDVLQGRPT